MTLLGAGFRRPCKIRPDHASRRARQRHCHIEPDQQPTVEQHETTMETAAYASYIVGTIFLALGAGSFVIQIVRRTRRSTELFALPRRLAVRARR